MLVLIVALAGLAATAMFAKLAPRSPWPVFTTTAAIAAFWVWLIDTLVTDARPADIPGDSDIGSLPFALLASASIASVFVGGWMVVSALVPAGRRPAWQFIALALGGLGFVAIGFIAVGVIGSTAARAGHVEPLAHIPVLATGLIGALFAGYLAYGRLYATVARAWFDANVDAGTGPNAVIVLGARIVNGRLTRLLERRVELGIETADRLWLASSTRGNGTTFQDGFHDHERLEATDQLARLVFSGGSPSSRSPSIRSESNDPPESHAMAAEAEARGVRRDLVVVEDESTTTAENFRMSAQILEARGISQPYVGVTNSFHAYRASLHMRRAGIDGHVLGGASGSLSGPFHVLREFAAFFYEMAQPS